MSMTRDDLEKRIFALNQIVAFGELLNNINDGEDSTITIALEQKDGSMGISYDFAIEQRRKLIDFLKEEMKTLEKEKESL